MNEYTIFIKPNVVGKPIEFFADSDAMAKTMWRAKLGESTLAVVDEAMLFRIDRDKKTLTVIETAQKK